MLGFAERLTEGWHKSTQHTGYQPCACYADASYDCSSVQLIMYGRLDAFCRGLGGRRLGRQKRRAATCKGRRHGRQRKGHRQAHAPQDAPQRGGDARAARAGTHHVKACSQPHRVQGGAPVENMHIGLRTAQIRIAGRARRQRGSHPKGAATAHGSQSSAPVAIHDTSTRSYKNTWIPMHHHKYIHDGTRSIGASHTQKVRGSGSGFEVYGAAC
mmetsp:Transcript_43569/g.130659  ORF Transcript_43569/g.130659 Transcript_43569/m.130659 type:complete len:214 (+) Transcript_43569:1339-1980(+)